MRKEQGIWEPFWSPEPDRNHAHQWVQNLDPKLGLQVTQIDGFVSVPLLCML